MNSLEMPSHPWVSLVLRLGLALFSGAVIGWDRQAADKPAGLRTHMLVSVGAAIFVLGALEDSAESASRAVQGVAAGIGFIGAGEILHVTRNTDQARVKGLTSAAAVWVSAALGVSAGYGLWRLALLGSIVTFLVLTAAKWLEAHMPGDQDKR
jgi:putative Mg2+ transporter-C (MgtC) family protein